MQGDNAEGLKEFKALIDENNVPDRRINRFMGISLRIIDFFFLAGRSGRRIGAVSEAGRGKSEGFPAVSLPGKKELIFS